MSTLLSFSWDLISELTCSLIWLWALSACSSVPVCVPETWDPVCVCAGMCAYLCARVCRTTYVHACRDVYMCVYVHICRTLCMQHTWDVCICVCVNASEHVGVHIYEGTLEIECDFHCASRHVPKSMCLCMWMCHGVCA